MRHAQRGSTIVEFALVLLIFLMFLLGIVDFSRMLFTWNAATEATRAGARYAVVCDDSANQAAVLSRMQQLLPQITSASVSWAPAGCTAASCESVTVAITGLNHNWISPIPGVIARTIPSAPFSTTLIREIMRQDPNGNSPAICL
jgi:Flp pilus assembly protein TadG